MNVFAGHSLTHDPLEKKGVAEPAQVRQSVLVGPSHVPHAASHVAHWPLLESAYLPSGVQLDTQLPVSMLRKGDAGAHVTHSVSSVPAHVAQLSWQAVHMSAVALSPPEHVKPSSIAVQSALQPSKATVLPSSHASFPTRLPSPQTGAHVSFE